MYEEQYGNWLIIDTMEQRTIWHDGTKNVLTRWNKEQFDTMEQRTF